MVLETTHKKYVKGKGYVPTTSFSGADMVVQIAFPNTLPITLGSASNISYSLFRDTYQVKTIGRTSAKGFTKGTRTIAGTIIFTVINQHVVNEIKQYVPYLQNYAKIKIDELPPFDIIVTFANEYGQSARLIIYGVQLFEESKTLSIEDLFTENVMSYKALDIDYMQGTATDPSNFYDSPSHDFQENSKPIAKFKVGEVLSSTQYEEYQKFIKNIK